MACTQAERRADELESALAETKATLTSRAAEAEVRALEADERLRDERVATAAANGALERELTAERRVAELQSQRADRSEERVAELQRGFDAMLGELERCKLENTRRLAQLQEERDAAQAALASAQEEVRHTLCGFHCR